MKTIDYFITNVGQQLTVIFIFFINLLILLSKKCYSQGRTTPSVTYIHTILIIDMIDGKRTSEQGKSLGRVPAILRLHIVLLRFYRCIVDLSVRAGIDLSLGWKACSKLINSLALQGRA